MTYGTISYNFNEHWTVCMYIKLWFTALINVFNETLDNVLHEQYIKNGIYVYCLLFITSKGRQSFE